MNPAVEKEKEKEILQSPCMQPITAHAMELLAYGLFWDPRAKGAKKLQLQVGRYVCHESSKGRDRFVEIFLFFSL